MSNKSTVFVVQDPDGKEIMLAKRYGTFRVILTGKETTSQAITKLQEALVDFTPSDYLLPIGKSINMGLAVHMAIIACKGKPVNVLVWRRQQYDYTVETIQL